MTPSAFDDSLLLRARLATVGRIARGEGAKGNALLFLIPEGLQFLSYLKVVAASFCFDCPPKVHLNIDNIASKVRKKMRKVDGSKHGFNDSNPYGRKGADDTHQFVQY